jgi:peroxiredoxin family protein
MERKMFEDNGRKLCIICSKGTLDMAYPGLVLANAALMEGIDVTMFFTFWGLDMVTKKRMNSLKCTPIGNPSMAMPNGMGIPNILGILPGMTDFSSSMMKKEIDKLDFPPISEFLQMISDAGAEMYGCKMSMDMMKLTENDLFDGVNAVVGAMEFMEMSENAQIIFI